MSACQQQRDDLLIKVVLQVGTLSKQLEIVLKLVFRLEGLGVNKLEEALDAGDKRLSFEEQNVNHTPFMPRNQLQETRWISCITESIFHTIMLIVLMYDLKTWRTLRMMEHVEFE